MYNRLDHPVPTIGVVNIVPILVPMQYHVRMDITIHRLVTDRHITAIKLMRGEIRSMVGITTNLSLRDAKTICDGLRDESLTLTLDVPEPFVEMVRAWLESHGFLTTDRTKRHLRLEDMVQRPLDDLREHFAEPTVDHHLPEPVAIGDHDGWRDGDDIPF